MNKKRRKSLILAAALVLLAVLAVVMKFNFPAEIWLADKINKIEPEKNHYVLFYEDNKLISGNPDYFNHDVQEIQVGNNKKYLINHARGFAMEFPRDAEFDFSSAADYISAATDDMKIVISKEYTPYTDGSATRGYVEEYLHKYLLADSYIENNRLTIHKNAIEKINKYWVSFCYPWVFNF